jgi:hypothetical protein
VKHEAPDGPPAQQSDEPASEQCPQAPDIVSEAYARYADEWSRLFGLVVFVGSLIRRADATALGAAEALLPGERDDERRRKLEETIARGGAGVEQTMQARYAHTFTRVVYQRAFDDFLTYVAELLHLVYASRPEALKSSETVRLDEILQFPTMPELLTFLTERRVERLAYQSIADLASDLEKTLGLCLFDTDAERTHAVTIAATRNLITHNGGVVNARYLRQVPSATEKLGELIWVKAETLFGAGAFLRTVAARADGRAIEHFGLPARVPTKEELANWLGGLEFVDHLR